VIKLFHTAIPNNDDEYLALTVLDLSAKRTESMLGQLLLRSSTRYFSAGSLVADSGELANGLMVITSGLVGVELPLESEEADVENRREGGKTLLYIFQRG
jgi:hypothetical protein